MASREKGKISAEDEKRLRLNYELLNTELDGQDLVDSMFQENIFSGDDMEEVRNAMPNTRKSRIEVFLKKLFTSGPNGYKVFLSAVRKAGYKHVADTLEKTVLVAENPEGLFVHSETDVEIVGSEDWFENVPESRRTDKVQEKELSRLVQAFGNGWELIAIELKIPQAKIEQVKMSHPNSVQMQMFNTFVKWRQREAGRATFQALIKALRACTDTATIDWDTVKHVVNNH